MNYPPWVVLHIPHDSTLVPEDVRHQFLLDDAELARELLRMTDHHTLALFGDASSDAAVVRAPVSRLVVDVERFPDDADEPMAAVGMGAVYTVTSQRGCLSAPRSARPLCARSATPTTRAWNQRWMRPSRGTAGAS